MDRRKTIIEVAYPAHEFVDMAKQIQFQAIDNMLDLFWRAVDLMKMRLKEVDISKAEDDVERSITQLLTIEMQRLQTGYEPYTVVHRALEHESRMPSPAQPPEYDIAFVLYYNPRIMWPLEAKVLKSERAVSPYVADILSQFMTCRYAPFSTSGAMVGYLLKGKSEAAIEYIANAVPCTMSRYPRQLSRAHWTSEHLREISDCRPEVLAFTCHHLMIEFGPKVPARKGSDGPATGTTRGRRTISKPKRPAL